MKYSSLTCAFVLTLACMCSSSPLLAQSHSYKQLSAEWWQWALSIPPSESPLLDPTGGNCMVGQRGDLWFLAGSFVGGPVIRNCTVPEGTTLFFPVLNSVNFDSPNVCGQPSQSVDELRALSAATISDASNLVAMVDGVPVKSIHHVRSQVFAVTLPEDNVFDEACAELGGVPAGVYSPAVDEGLYVRLNPLDVGTHSVHIHAESGDFVVDVTYNLSVVSVASF